MRIPGFEVEGRRPRARMEFALVCLEQPIGSCMGIVPLAADGLSNTAIARQQGRSLPTAGKWQQRFIDQRLDSLLDEPRSRAAEPVLCSAGFLIRRHLHSCSRWRLEMSDFRRTVPLLTLCVFLMPVANAKQAGISSQSSPSVSLAALRARLRKAIGEERQYTLKTKRSPTAGETLPSVFMVPLGM